jgi:hypothetical protein
MGGSVYMLQSSVATEMRCDAHLSDGVQVVTEVLSDRPRWIELISVSTHRGSLSVRHVRFPAYRVVVLPLSIRSNRDRNSAMRRAGNPNPLPNSRTEWCRNSPGFVTMKAHSSNDASHTSPPIVSMIPFPRISTTRFTTSSRFVSVEASRSIVKC